MNHVYILGGLRSYIGVKDGMYRHIPAEKLGAEVLREAISRVWRHFRQGFQSGFRRLLWICSAGRRWRRSARQQPRLKAGWRIWSLPGEWRVLRYSRTA